MNQELREYLAEIGRQGGRKSRRTLDSATARRMVRIREARRAFRTFYASCFWSFDPTYRITEADIPWVVQQLKEHGGRRGWDLGAKLSR